jgi:hypothetical protein
MMRCEKCNGSMVVHSMGMGGRGKRYQVRHYVCSHHIYRGNTACDNSLRIRVEKADNEVLSAIEAYALNPDVTLKVVRRAAQMIRERTAKQPDLAVQKRRELAKVERECARLTDALADAVAIGKREASALRSALGERETRIAELSVNSLNARMPPCSINSATSAWKNSYLSERSNGGRCSRATFSMREQRLAR